MSEGTTHLALFDDIEKVTRALDRLRELGVDEHDISVVSGVPYSEHILGRPMRWSNVGKIGMGGFLVGFAVSIALNWGTPLLYPVHVGGQALLPIPPTIILTFELSMLGLLASTFLGVLWESVFPSYGPKVYHPGISDGKIALVFDCPPEIHEQMHAVMADLGAEWVHRTEAQKL